MALIEPVVPPVVIRSDTRSPFLIFTCLFTSKQPVPKGLAGTVILSEVSAKGALHLGETRTTNTVAPSMLFAGTLITKLSSEPSLGATQLLVSSTEERLANPRNPSLWDVCGESIA